MLKVRSLNRGEKVMVTHYKLSKTISASQEKNNRTKIDKNDKDYKILVPKIKFQQIIPNKKTSTSNQVKPEKLKSDKKIKIVETFNSRSNNLNSSKYLSF